MSTLPNVACSLLQLPHELFEIILGNLGYAEIGWLRLTCKTLQHRTHYRFRQQFCRRETDLSTNSLQRLINAISHEEFGSAIQDLTVVAATYDPAYLKDLMDKDKHHAPYQFYPRAMPQRGPNVTDLTPEQLAQAKWEYNLFSQSAAEQPSVKALERQLNSSSTSNEASDTNPEESEKASLALTMLTIAFSQLGRLRTLSLESAVYKMAAMRLPAYKCTEWPQMWKKASSVFSAVMTTVAESQMQVQRLNIYGGQWGCSVPTFLVDDLVHKLRDQGLKEAFGGLKALALCVSVQVNYDNPHQYPAPTESDYKGLSAFLSLCPDLRDLDLHVYKLRHQWDDGERIFTEVSDNLKFSSLNRCTLRGLQLHQGDLMTFLRNSPNLQTLELRKLSLQERSWRPVFDYCSSSENTIDKVTLHLLYDPGFLYFGTKSVLDLFTLEGEDLKRGIIYQIIPREGESGFAALQVEYGPPEAVPLRLEFNGIRREG